MNFLNPELEIKNTESAIKNKQKKLLTGLRVFKYFVTLVLKLKKKKKKKKEANKKKTKTKTKMKQNIVPFIQTQGRNSYSSYSRLTY